MVNAFTVYDLVFLFVFTLAIVVFLYTRKKNLKREGLIYLYKTSFGIKLIEKFSKKYKKILGPLEYVVITSGYLLMAGMIWLLIKFSWVYLTSPIAAKAIKVPVLIPLVPYLPDIFQLDFLPSFNFTYWIIIIAVLAIPHEFAHGIFARLNKIKIHSTGFGFLGPFLAAFVEQDEKDMTKASKKAQLSVLAAGTFANVLTLILSLLLLWAFFSAAFTPAGVNFNTYTTEIIPTADLEVPNNYSLSDEFVQVQANNEIYYTDPLILEQTLAYNLSYTAVYEDSPAFNARLKGAISEINDEKITSYSELSNVLDSYSPGQTVEIKTLYQDSVRTNKVEALSYNITLGENNGSSYLGIGISQPRQSGVMGFVYNTIAEIKDPTVFYESKLGAFGWFIYFLLWWMSIILVSVALVNMLPVGMFDGGRFFYLSVWALTGSEKIGMKAFKASTWIILALVAALMVKWALIFV